MSNEKGPGGGTPGARKTTSRSVEDGLPNPSAQHGPADPEQVAVAVEFLRYCIPTKHRTGGSSQLLARLCSEQAGIPISVDAIVAAARELGFLVSSHNGIGIEKVSVMRLVRQRERRRLKEISR